MFADKIRVYRRGGLASVAASTTRSAAHGSFKFALPLLQASCRHCAKPLVVSSVFVSRSLRFQYLRWVTSGYFHNPKNNYQKNQSQDAEIDTGKEKYIQRYSLIKRFKP